MKITYIFRTQSKQRSIERVFEPVINAMIDEGNDVQIEYAKSGGNLFMTLWENIWYFRKISKHCLCHITGDVQYVACLMRPSNTLLTIHDLVPLHNKNVPWYSKWLCYWLWYYIPLRRLKRVTCISEATRQDLLSFFPWVADRITVIPNPIDSSFKFTPMPFNLECPRILHIGTKPNKNLLRVIEALAGYRCHLRIIGKLNEEYVEALNTYHIDYSNEYGISDEQVIKEYQDCDIVSFPSLFEGFGMPIIEGQAIGRVVVTSNIEPMLSVAGDGAIIVNPYDVTSIRNGFFGNSLDSFQSIVEKGLENASFYSGKRITNEYIKQYKELCTIS